MSTPNFKTQRDFDLYCYDEWDISQEQIDDTRKANEYSENISDDKIEEWIAEDNIRFLEEEFDYNLEKCSEELNRELNFYEVTLEGGHYGGVQFYVSIKDQEFSPYSDNLSDILEWVDNEETRYYYDMCLSEFKRKIKSEINFINKKYLPLLARKLGFEHYNCVGVFSNGEAIYEKVK